MRLAYRDACLAISVIATSLTSCAEMMEADPDSEMADEEGTNVGEDSYPITEAPIGNAPPFAVRLLFLDAGGNCTGVVISQHWLVTAAHCVRDAVNNFGIFNNSRLTIRYGSNGTSTGTASYSSGAASYYIHPDYSGDDDDLEDDFALVRLYGSGMSVYTRSRIMGETDSCFFPSSISNPRIAGYGSGTDPGGGGDCPSTGSGWKRSGAFATLNNCGLTKWSPRSPFIRQIMVGSGTRIPCSGDSGGPIYFHYDGLDIVAGLHAGTRSDPFSDNQSGPSIRRRLEWIIDKSIDDGIPLDCQAGFSDVGPDWWSCRE